MKVVIYGEEREYPVITVTLVADPLHPLDLTLFKCTVCGENLGQYQGNIVRMIPGGLPINIMDVPRFIIQCRICKRRYLINNIA
jgi:hypothetical protein